MKAFRGQPNLQDRPVILVAGLISTHPCSDFWCHSTQYVVVTAEVVAAVQKHLPSKLKDT